MQRRNEDFMGFFDRLKNKKNENEDTAKPKASKGLNSQEENIDLTIPANVKEYVKKEIANLIEEETVLKDNSVFIPKWNVSIFPEVQEAHDRSVILDFYIQAAQWGKTLYECSVGMGSDPKTNIGLALGSFIFAFMRGIAAMEEEQEGISLTTKFIGKTHKWKVYKTDIVGMGKKKATFEDINVYWDALKDGILNRLGNQRLCYVKIFGSKMGDNVTGECRIDDIESKELSAKVAEIVSKWQANGFASEKQFFFIRQEEDTILPYPYEGDAGFQLLKEKVALAAKMFHESNSQELYDTLPKRLEEALNDRVLGKECFSFLPELCTEHAFPEISYSEKVQFYYSNGDKIEVYKSQLANYERLKQALFSVFNDGTLGEAVNDIYREYVGTSAIYSCIEQVNEKGSDLKNIKMTTLVFQVDDDFVIR